jgi:hypothetical protein
MVSLTTAERAPTTHWEEGWMGPRTDQDEAERRKILPLPGLELWSLCSRYTDLLSRIPTIYMQYKYEI